MQTGVNLKIKRDESGTFVGRYFTPSKEPIFRQALKEARKAFKASGLSDVGRNELVYVVNSLRKRFPYDKNIKQKCLRRLGFIEPEKRTHTAFELKLRDIYFETVSRGLKHQKQINYIIESLEKEMPEELAKRNNINDDIMKHITNYSKRYKLFFDKARTNRFTHFATFTYDDKLHTEESFKAKLKTVFSHFSNRRGWRFMGCFERGEIGERLHLHLLIYIPKGQMVGTIENVKHYSYKAKGLYTMRQNSFFKRYFGENDFSPIDEDVLRLGDTLSYIVKYCFKKGEYAYYSRHLSSALEQEELPYEYIFHVFDKNGENFTFRDGTFDFISSGDATPSFIHKEELKQFMEVCERRRLIFD